MCARILIIEDEILVAMEMEAVVEDLGHVAVGIAADSAMAYRLAEHRPDVALVDVNLRDGATGPKIAARLAEKYGVGVVFCTANPRMAMGQHTGAFGAMEKPCDPAAIGAAIDYALQKRAGINVAPPARMLACA
jgi:two-component system, response regulator PdtaR